MKTSALADPFAEDVRSGLTASSKSLPSKYFYDDNGSRIFMQIMNMPEYYPTACELEIVSQQSGAIAGRLPFRGHFNVIEFGPGDGIKTRHLLKALTNQGAPFTYIPIDISQEAIDVLQKNITNALTGIDMQPETGDYFQALGDIDNSRPALFLFLGGNIGNYKDDEAIALLQKLYGRMKPGDMLLSGIDLQKHPRVIQKAYDDPYGITRAFNMNLLIRINRELDADICLDQFDFYCDYNPQSGEVNSYLVSLKKQHFHSALLNTTFHFEKDELIWTELSKKYTPDGISALAKSAGFTVVHNFMDCRHYFTDSLWIK